MKDIMVYINYNYRGIAVFTMENIENDCLYFGTWFNEEDFEKIADMAQSKNYDGIKKYCSDCDNWDGNEEDMESFEQFSNSRDYDCWSCVAGDF